MSDYERSPWTFSDPFGCLVLDGQIRVLGFKLPQRALPGPARCASRLPAVVELQPGLYRWCSCGYSKTQPFCDSANCDAGQGVGRTGYEFKVLTACEVSLCNCKQTARPPFCDEAHRCADFRRSVAALLDDDVPPARDTPA